MFTLIKRQTHTCILLVLSALVFTANNVAAQENTADIPVLFNQYQQNNIQEKIFVHTDKSFYVAGEIIWFKIYAVDAVFNKPLNISKVAYIEILDAANKPLLQAKIALQNGLGSGSLYIPFTANSGSFTLRAYTNWMKNFGAEYFFQKAVTIVNTQKNAVPATAATDSKKDIQFFPEGGNLVDGIESKLAYKAVDAHGKGLAFTATLIDNTDTITHFAPSHNGMGSITIIPRNNHSYKAIFSFADGQKISKSLPEVYTSGYVLGVKDSGAGKLSITVQTNIATATNIFLLVHTNGAIKTATGGILLNGAVNFLIDKTALGNGISHITVFNSKRQPVCERLYFKKPAQQLQLELKTDKSDYAPRAKVNMNLEAMNASAAKDDTASLSMAVYRVDTLQSADAATIDNYLLLGAEIKGYVEDPQYYFANSDAAAAAALDNLMLTNGWRRFKWENILQPTKPLFAYVPEYNGHIITGKVINTNTGNVQKDAEVFLTVPGIRTQFVPARSDAAGNVQFELKNMYGSADIIVQPDTQLDSMYRVDTNNPFFAGFSSTPVPAFQLPQTTANTLLENSISMQVQNIYAAKKLKQFNFPVIDTTAFYLRPDASYLLDDYTRFTTLEEVLREYVTLVNVAKREGKNHLPVYNSSTKLLFNNDPLLLVDGMPVFDMDKFLKFDPLKLKKLEVINKRYILGGSSFSGILNWQTYGGDLGGFPLDPHAVVVDYDGLQLEREFYAPAYITEAEQSGHLPDFRNVLQWMPAISIPVNGKQALGFYTSDLPGKYAAVIQGISTNGLCGSKVIYFDVKK